MESLEKEFYRYYINTNPEENAKKDRSRQQIQISQVEILENLHPDFEAKDVYFLYFPNPYDPICVQLFDLVSDNTSNLSCEIESLLFENSKPRANTLQRIYNQANLFLERNYFPTDSMKWAHLSIPLPISDPKQSCKYSLNFTLVRLPHKPRVCRIGYSLLKI